MLNLDFGSLGCLGGFGTDMRAEVTRLGRIGAVMLIG
jgi:hypothetical protein